MYDLLVKSECIRLRQVERLSIKSIAKRTGVSAGTLSVWLKGCPLTSLEKKKRMSMNAKCNNVFKKKSRGKPSKFTSLIDFSTLTGNQKGRIAEAAVLYRLTLYNLSAYKSPFDGDAVDFYVRLPSGKCVSVEVRCVREHSRGLPYVLLGKRVGRGSNRRIRDYSFDFIVGYDIFTDTAYVYSQVELLGNRLSVTISSNAAECWEKLLMC